MIRRRFVHDLGWRTQCKLPQILWPRDAEALHKIRTDDAQLLNRIIVFDALGDSAHADSPGNALNGLNPCLIDGATLNV